MNTFISNKATSPCSPNREHKADHIYILPYMITPNLGKKYIGYKYAGLSLYSAYFIQKNTFKKSSNCHWPIFTSVEIQTSELPHGRKILLLKPDCYLTHQRYIIYINKQQNIRIFNKYSTY